MAKKEVDKILVGEFVPAPPRAADNVDRGSSPLESRGESITDEEIWLAVQMTANEGMNLDQVAFNLLVDKTTLWLALTGPRGRALYAHAREIRAESDVSKLEGYTDRIIDTVDRVLGEHPTKTRLDPDSGRVAIQGLSKAIDAKQWAAERRAVRIWGPRQIIEGDASKPLNVILRPGDDRV